MNEYKAARLRANLTQQSMSEEFGIPKRNIGRWENNEVEPPVWVKKLLLKELERLGDKVEKELLKDTYLLGFLLGYIDRAYIKQRERSGVTPVLRDRAYREPLTGTTQVLTKARKEGIKLNEDLIMYIFGAIEYSEDSEGMPKNKLFGIKLNVEEQGHFSVGDMRGRAFVFSPIYKAFEKTGKRLTELASEYDLNPLDLICLLTGYKETKDYPVEVAEKFAKALGIGLDKFAELKYVG